MAQEAHVWEALTYMKAAPVAGNPGLGRRVIAGLTARLVERFATYPDLENELRRMRRRLEKERVVPSSNTKTAFGGYYDVDFALSYLRLRHRVEISPPANTTQQLGRLNSAGILGQADAATLMRGAEFLRAIDHAVRLVTGRPASGLPEQAGPAEAVQNLARIWGLVQGSDPVAGRLREVQQEIRSVYRRVVGEDERQVPGTGLKRE
jgi:glutamate-ammonia-ligase adenylyltransferase